MRPFSLLLRLAQLLELRQLLSVPYEAAWWRGVKKLKMKITAEQHVVTESFNKKK